MNLKFLIALLFTGTIFMSCQTLYGDSPLTLEAVSLKVGSITITANQDLSLLADVKIGGGIGDPAQFRVEFLNGAEVLTSGNVSSTKRVEKSILITKAMNGTLQLKARAISSGTPIKTVESQVVFVTVNIP
jgi:hypothetical protein